MLNYSHEKLMVEAPVSFVSISLFDFERKIYEVATFCSGSHMYEGLGNIRIHTTFVKIINGIAYETCKSFMFDSNFDDVSFTPVVCLPTIETVQEIEDFFKIKAEDVIVSLDQKSLFKKKYEKGFVWNPLLEDFIHLHEALDTDASYAKLMHGNDWNCPSLYNPSETIKR